MLAAIFISLESAAPMEALESAKAIATKGLAGDRYATGRGFYTGVVEWDAHVTLVASEPFAELEKQHGIKLDPAALRRNLVTKGVDLESLIGAEFRIGEQAVFRGRKAWPPCSHIVKLSGRTEIFEYLARQCGIGADVLLGGTIRRGDRIVVL